MPVAVGRKDRLTALLIDDHSFVLDALQVTLRGFRLFDRIDQERSLANAMTRLRDSDDYDLIFLDLHMSDSAGGDTIVRLREEFPDVPVVIFSGDESIESMQVAFTNGVLGYISKRLKTSEVKEAIEEILTGRPHIPNKYRRKLGFAIPVARVEEEAAPSPVQHMTPRQQEVFDYLIQGVPNKVIAARLGIEENTAKSHVSAIYRIFGAKNRAHLILKAARLGLV